MLINLRFKDFCINVKSNKEAKICSSAKDKSSGGPIELLQNNIQKVIIPSGFEDFNFCFDDSSTDKENDEFQFRIMNEDDVSLFNMRYKNSVRSIQKQIFIF